MLISCNLRSRVASPRAPPPLQSSLQAKLGLNRRADTPNVAVSINNSETVGTMNWRIRIEPFTRPLFFAWSRWTRGMTLGVRALAVDPAGRVMLVKHTYLAGWWLPGGGVDRRETCDVAAARELFEETGLTATAPGRLLSLHSNARFFPGDHVAVYRFDAFTPGERTHHGEIAEIGWFDPLDLPPDAHRSTTARMAEIFGGAPVDPNW